MIAPVLAYSLGNFFTLIWIVLIIIGVIRSMVTSAKKSLGTVKAVRPQVAQVAAAPAEPVAPPAVSTLTAPAPLIVPAARPAPSVVAQPPPTHGTKVFRGMFERGNLVRAIIAAEVLGPPKALQEQSIWSPRHSEPSI